MSLANNKRVVAKKNGGHIIRSMSGRKKGK
jgi:hypothetical protein